MVFIIGFILVFGAGGWILGYIYGFNSEAYKSARNFLKESAKVNETIGNIESDRLAFYNFLITSQNDHGEAVFSMILRGTKIDAEVFFEMDREDSKWKINKAILQTADKKVIDLKQDNVVESVKSNKSIDELAKEDFDVVIAGKKPLNAIFDKEHGLPADGGTTYYRGDGYKLEIKQTMTRDDKENHGFLYGPIITFESIKENDQPKIISDVRFYKTEDLKKLKFAKFKKITKILFSRPSVRRIENHLSTLKCKMNPS